MIYLDNNATTVMPPCVMKAMLKWCNMGNPSSEYSTAKGCKKMFSEFRDFINSRVSSEESSEESIGEMSIGEMSIGEMSIGEMSIGEMSIGEMSNYKIIFTSGASESNCTLIRSVVSSVRRVTTNSSQPTSSQLPHIVCSSIEHKSILLCLESLQKDNQIIYTLVDPHSDGVVYPEDIEDAIGIYTCLIICMHANNETGVINDIDAIGSLAHRLNIPFHCDTVQTFGKYKISSICDSFVISFHKLHGPPGCGALAIKKEFYEGYDLQGIINGTQNNTFRGGTENVPGIGASFAAARYTLIDRERKNNHLMELKRAVIIGLSKILPLIPYTNYYSNRTLPPCEIVIFGMNTLPNTLLFSVIKRTGAYACNRKIKNCLEKHGIILSVGSACNTDSDKASHVLSSLDADVYIRKGTLRLSLGDENTINCVKKFLRCFAKALREQKIKCV